MGQELVVPVVEALDERVRGERQRPVPARKLLERLRQHALPLRQLRRAPGQAGEVVVGPPDRPLHHEAELEGAAVVDPLRPVVGRGLPHVHGAEVRRARRRHPVLRHPRVRAADGADVAVAPGLSGHPLDRVVAVAVLPPAVVVEGDEAPLRGEAPADVLDHHGVSQGREERGRPDLALGRVVLAVRRPLEERRERPLALRHVDVGAEHRPVAHGLGHVPENGELGVPTGHVRLLEATPSASDVLRATWA